MTLFLKMKTNYLNIFYLIYSILLQCTYCTMITQLNESNNLTTIPSSSSSSSSSPSLSAISEDVTPRQTYHFKYSIDELLNSKFEKKISDDIDYDPCKSGGFMGDIALPNINYESEWQTQKLNKSFQQELERMKQEVYHEGLQVEEEGLTDIIRKKTKLPNINQNGEDNLSNERHKNDAAIILDNSVRQPMTSSPTTTTSTAAITIPSSSSSSSNDTQSSTNTEGNDGNKSIVKDNVKNTTTTFRHNIDEKKIQSDTKDIIDDSGDHIITLRKPIASTTTTILPIIQPLPAGTPQSVHSPDPANGSGSNKNGISNRNRFNDGTAVVQVINSENTYNRKRHRRRRQGRNKGSVRGGDTLKNTHEYKQRFQRLKDELNRPVLTAEELHSKSTNAKRHQHQNQHPDQHSHNNHHQKHKITNTNSESKLKVVKPLMFEEQEQSAWLNDMPVVQQQPEELEEEEVTTYKIINKKKPTIYIDPPPMEDDQTTVMPLMEKNDDDHRLKELQHHHRITRAATAKKERIWDYGVIPYEIDGNFSGAHKALFKQAMRHWENSTCIKFVERDPDHHPNFIIFTTRPCGCCSFVGKRGNGGQAISIGKNCDKFGIVVHELGHVVGFWHEHTRPDRENHVVIDKHNIIIGQEYNFNKLTSEDVDSLGLPYDYDSIMHYAKNTFSRGTYLDTILPVEVEGFKRPEIGQRIKLSDGDISQASLLYKCPKCGRTFQDTSGQFSSPNYNLNSQNIADSMQCEWRITATHGEKIILNITDLDIYKSANCTTDYLEIRDGYWHKSPILVRYCGSGKIAELIQSTGSRMLLTYTSTNSNTHRGFSASYEAICGGDLHIDNSSVHLESPNYPLDYLQNKECIWKITVPEEFQVALRFQSFEVENHDNCIYDYVEVRDGDKANSTLIGIFCGFKIPPDMRSTSNKMYVKFFSDGSVQKAGFSAIFIKELDECELNNHGCEHECINTLGGYQCSCNIGYELNDDEKSCQIDTCGGMIIAPSGVITSPSFPNLYPIDKNCVWEIIAPVNFRILLNFTHFDLEGNHLHQLECEYDSISVYSKLYQDNLKRHGIFCGTTIPEAITSESNELRIEFKSDKNVQKSGFAAVFTTDIDECATNNGGCMHECKNTMGAYYCTCHNGYVLHENKLDCKEGGCKYEITAPQGQIYSPNYPEYYPPGKDCVWHFSTTPGHRIRLTFTFFEMEPHQECAYDHIAIYNGNSEDGLALGRFCGSKLPYAISAYSNEMYMIFKSDVSVQRKGFAATHFTACGGRLKATNKLKHFYSHSRFGDSIYDSNSECDWVIEADPGRNVQLMFLSFTIEDEQNCSYDYVDIFGGLDDFSGPLYGRYCGHNKPPEIISLHEALLVRFVTDATMAFKGFSASYVALDPFEDTEEMSSDSSEMSTPFPGYFKNIYIINGEDEDEDEYHDYDYPNKIKQTKINSDNTLFI